MLIVYSKRHFMNVGRIICKILIFQALYTIGLWSNYKQPQMPKDKTKNYTAAKCLHLFRKPSNGWNQEKWLSYYCQEELRGPYSIV